MITDGNVAWREAVGCPPFRTAIRYDRLAINSLGRGIPRRNPDLDFELGAAVQSLEVAVSKLSVRSLNLGAHSLYKQKAAVISPPPQMNNSASRRLRYREVGMKINLMNFLLDHYKPAVHGKTEMPRLQEILTGRA